MVWTKLDIAPGIFADDTETADEGQWQAGSGVRFVRGKPQTGKGFESIVLSNVTGMARGGVAWASADGVTNIAVGTNTNFYIFRGGEYFDITPSGLAAGLADGTGPGGYGTGTYGTGVYGTGSPAEFFPRTWCCWPFGDQLLISPRGGTIYLWDGDTSHLAAALTGAPDQVNSFFLDPAGRVVALGANEEVTDDYNPLLPRWSDQSDITDWASSAADQAGEFPLNVGSRLVAGIPGGNGVNALWTDSHFITQTDLGDPGLVYKHDVRGKGGLIGPNAATLCPDGYWRWWGSDGQFYQSAGGPPQPIPCPCRDEVNDNLAPVQQDKICAGVNSAFTECVWFYPDARDGNENSRCIRLNYLTGDWSIGLRARTIWIDQGPLSNPAAVSPTGRLYYEDRGFTADGSPLASFIRSGFMDLGDGDTILEIHGFRPDFMDLQGTVDLYIYTKMAPQDAEVTNGPFTITSATTELTFIIAARQAAFEFRSNSSPSYWRGGSPRADIIDTGDQY